MSLVRDRPLVAIASPVAAQLQLTTIDGVVTIPHDRRAAGAAVTLLDRLGNTVRVAVSSADGTFRIVGGPAGPRPLDDARRAAAARAAAGDPQRDAWPLLRVELPGQTLASPARARRPPRRHRARRVRGGEGDRRDPRASRPPANTRALAGVDPARMARAARARAPIREARAEAPLGHRRCGRRRRGAAGRDGLVDFGASSSARCSSTSADPVASWGELRAFQDTLIDAAGEGVDELRIEAEGTDLELGVKGRAWVNSDGKRNMPSGEVFTGPHEDVGRGHVRFTSPPRPRGVDVDGRRARVPRRRGRRRARAERGDELPRPRARRPTRARGAWARSGIGTNFGIDRADRRDPLRREDRRDGAPRARPLLSGDRRQEQ